MPDWYAYMMDVDPPSNTICLTVPIVYKETGSVEMNFKEYDKAVKERGWPVIVVNVDEFESFDLVNVNNVGALAEMRVADRLEHAPAEDAV